jgi:ribosome maturation protein SDO1
MDVLTPYVMNKEKTNLEELDTVAALQLRTDFDEDGKGGIVDEEEDEEEEKMAKKKKKKRKNNQKGGQEKAEESDDDDKPVKGAITSTATQTKAGTKAMKPTERILQGLKEEEAKKEETSSKALKCNSCKGSGFDTKEEFRQHHKTEWHLFNLKRKQNVNYVIASEVF